jgi:hypothetical protein
MKLAKRRREFLEGLVIRLVGRQLLSMPHTARTWKRYRMMMREV